MIVSIALVPALAFQAYTEADARRVREQVVQEEALRLVRLVASEQQRIVEGAEQVLNVIGGTPDVQDNLPEFCKRMLINLIQGSPRYKYAGVFGLDGHLLCAPGPLDPSLNVSDRTYFRMALQTGGVVIGEYEVGRATRQPIIPMAKPFRNRDGTVGGIVEVSLSIDWLAQQIGRLSLPPAAIVWIVDRNGAFLVRQPSQARFIGQPIPAGNRFVLEGSEVGVAAMTSLDRGRPIIVAYSPPGADPKGLSIGVGLDRENTFKAVATANLIGLMLIFLAAVLALATTALVGGRLIGRPVSRLLAAAAHWRSGNFAARTGLPADSSEFGRLAAAFDAMAEAQGNRERALRASEAGREQAEAARATRELDWREAQRVGHIGSWHLDTATDVLTGSDEFQRIYGLDPATQAMPAFRKQRQRFYPIESWERIDAAVQQAVETGVGYELDVEAFCGANRIWVTIRCETVCDPQGRVIGLRGTVQDITAGKRAEEALRQMNETLEARVREEVAAREVAQARAAQAERLQALGQLAGGIAHDFNNVLQAVEGAVQLIGRHHEDEARVRRLTRLALEATARGASVTRRLLTFSRRSDLRSEAIDPAELLAGLREMLTHTLGAATLVEVRAEAGIPPLLADKGQLATVLVNLATNARDAMPSGGRLTFLAEAESVGSGDPAHPAGLAPGRYVRLTVADTGMGMDAATLARLGEPFFTTKEPGAGTGLGLPMAKGFVEQSGGALNIESSPGKGTTVTLWLPEAGAEVRASAAASPDVPSAAVSGTAEASTSMRLLLVDDEVLVRGLLAEQLENEGFRVLVAASGTEALALLAMGEEVDAVVTDLSMPGMDGLAVIRAAQEFRPGLPAMLLTGYARDHDALAMGAAVSGTFALLRKPVRIRELVDRIQALLAAPLNAA
jgi:signal transduction histidine kinase/ActR/RegA family two-component response regulator/HAMP domain-containing protein